MKRFMLILKEIRQIKFHVPTLFFNATSFGYKNAFNRTVVLILAFDSFSMVWEVPGTIDGCRNGKRRNN